MLSKTFISAALAASLALVPATQAAADKKDFIAGAIIGGIGGAIIQNGRLPAIRRLKEPRDTCFAEFRQKPLNHHIQITEQNWMFLV